MNPNELRPVAAGLLELCRWAAALRFEDIPQAVRERAALVLADTVGVALAGSAEREMRALSRDTAAPGSGAADSGAVPAGRSTLLAAGLPCVPPGEAAFLNATAIGFMELDQGSRPTGHPALHVLPPTLAAAEAEGGSGREFLAAALAGHEVQARLQWAVRFRPDLHPHGHMGAVAAAVALARLRGWDGDAAFRAACAAASLALATTWQPCLRGASVRNAWAGFAGQAAATALRLVAAGFTSDADAVEDVFGGVLGTEVDPEPLARDLGGRWHILEDYFKFHAACALTHPALDAVAAALRAERRPGGYPSFPLSGAPAPDEIESVTVGVPERNLRLASAPVGHDLSLKFSLPYAVAAFLALGATGPDAFRVEHWRAPAVAELVSRVRVQGDPALTSQWPRHHGAWVRIRLRDGRELRGTCLDPFGTAGTAAGNGSAAKEDTDPDPADLRAKFLAIGAAALPEPALAALWDDLLAVGERERAGDAFTAARRLAAEAAGSPATSRKGHGQG